MNLSRPARQRAAALTCVLAVLVAVLAIFTFYADRVHPAQPDAAKYFTDTPRWSVMSGSDGQPMLVSSQVSAHGLAAAMSLPEAMTTAVRAESVRHRDPEVWTNVTTLMISDGNHINLPEVFVASADGVTQPVGAGNIPVAATFDPPVIVLPKDVRVGGKWSQQGTATYDGLDLFAFDITNEIRTVGDDGCVVVRSRNKFTPSETGKALGGSDYDEVVESTTCPGKWITGSSSGDRKTTYVSAQAAAATRAKFAEPIPTGAADTTEAVANLLPRQTPFPGSADPLVVPNAQVAVDFDESAQVASGTVWNATIPFPVWRLPGNGPVVANPVVAGSNAIIADSNGVVSAVEAVSGYVRWQRRLDRLPMRLAASSDGRSVAVLDRSGTAVLLNTATGATIVTSHTDEDPIGVGVSATGDLIIADGVGLHGVDVKGHKVFDAALTVTTPPVWVGADLAVGTDDGEVVLVKKSGIDKTIPLETDSIAQLVAGRGAIVAATGAEIVFLDATGKEHARVDDDALALTLDDSGKDTTITATSIDGRVRVYSAAGELLRQLNAPVTTANSVAPASQRAAAVTVGQATWVSGLTGLLRLTGDSR